MARNLRNSSAEGLWVSMSLALNFRSTRFTLKFPFSSSSCSQQCFTSRCFIPDASLVAKCSCNICVSMQDNRKKPHPTELQIVLHQFGFFQNFAHAHDFTFTTAERVLSSRPAVAMQSVTTNHQISTRCWLPVQIIAGPVSIEESLNDVQLACLRHERSQISWPLDVPHSFDQLPPWLSVGIPEPLAHPSRRSLQIRSTVRHVEDRAHTADLYSSGCSLGSSSPGSVCFSSFGLIDGRQSFICIIVNTEVSYLSSSFTHIPSLSMILRAPTCSNESPTPMMGESFKTITPSRYANTCIILLAGPVMYPSSTCRSRAVSKLLVKNCRGLQTLFERSWAILRQQCFNEMILPSSCSFASTFFATTHDVPQLLCAPLELRWKSALFQELDQMQKMHQNTWYRDSLERQQIDQRSVVNIRLFEKCWMEESTKNTKVELCSEVILWKTIRDLMQFLQNKDHQHHKDRSKSHGYHIQTARVRSTSSRCSLCLYPGKNGRCSQIIENYQTGMSRHLDSSTTTQMA